MGMVKQYFTNLYNYKKKYGNKIILLWQCGHFFEVYALKDGRTGEIKDSNIQRFGNICDYQVKDKKTSTSSGKKSQKYKDIDGKTYTVMMSGLPIFGAVESKISKLNDHGFTVALWKQVENMKDVREEFGIYSPGTKFIESNELSNNIMCIYMECFPTTLLHKNPRISCGLSIIDVITGDTKFYEYHSEYFNESINYDEIERFNSIYNPSEVIIIHNFEDEKKVKNMIEYSAIHCNLKHILKIGDENSFHSEEIKNCKKQTYQVKTMNECYKVIDSDFFYANFAMYEYATASFCFLLNFVNSHQKNLTKKIKQPIFDNNSNTIMLANHSLKQLNIIHMNSESSNRKLSSVLKFLNNCSTAMGKREFSNQLLHPSTNEAYLNNEYAMMDYFIEHQDKYFEIKNDLKKLMDIDKFYRKIILERATPANIYNFYTNLKTINNIWKTISKDKTIKNYLKSHNLNINVKKINTALIKRLSSDLLLNVASQIDTIQMDENIFVEGFNEEVDKVVHSYELGNKEMQSIITFLNNTLSKCEKKNKNGIKLNVTEKSYPYLTMTSRRSGILKELLKKSGNVKNLGFDFRLDELVWESSTKTNVKLLSPQLNDLYKRIFEGKDEIKKVVRKTYKNYMKNLLEFGDSIENVSKFVKIMDILLTKCELAVKYHYCKPQINDHSKSFLNAKKMRHVLIEHIQENEIYVPNDVEVGHNKDGMLLYGTNAVGKSSLIKSIGICIIMAQAGMYVPCSEFKYKPYKSLYTRILGNDDIFKGLSSFAVEMSELKSILRADENSLILGDELCRGTEFNSAIRIFMAGLMMLSKKGCSHIFATHFHEITKMPEITNLNRLVMNHMSVSYNRELKTLVYDRKLKDGPGTNNYGLLVCKSLGLSDEFIQLAENMELDFKLLKDNFLKANQSKYNSKFIKGKCELCKLANVDVLGVDIHHMHPQNMSKKGGIIDTKNYTFNKNHKANLMNLCKSCHLRVTKDETIYVKKKTLKGSAYMAL